MTAEGDPEPDAAALAAQLATVRETLAHLQVILAGQRGQLAAADRRMDAAGLDDLGGRFARLAQTVADALDAASPRGPAVPRWDRLAGDARAVQLASLRKWVAEVLMPYYVDGGPYELAACWAEHPHSLWELSVLCTQWRYVYDRPRPGPIGQAAEWHDRWLPGVMRRVGDTLRECNYGHRGG